MGAASTVESGDPVAEINTTPLIDVMLVLLIMFIITIPIQTHSVPIDLPGPSPVQPEIHRDRNRIAVEPNGQISWNGTPTDLTALRTYLDLTVRLQPAPELQLMPHPEARYERVDEVLATIKRSAAPNLGFVGNERYRDF